MQDVAVPTVADATGRVTPTVSGSLSISGNQQTCKFGFPCGLVGQGLGINGQQLGVGDGWNKILGTNGAIM